MADFIIAHVTSKGCETVAEGTLEPYCCDFADLTDGDRHSYDCINADGADDYQWQTTTPDDVYLED